MDAIATMLDATADKVPAAEGKATKSVDTLTNLSAYLTLYRWASVGFLGVVGFCARIAQTWQGTVTS